MRAGRFACLFVPDLPLAALLRVHPERHGELLAVAEGDQPRSRLLAVSPEAARAGVTPGITAAQARAIDRRLSVYPSSDDHLRHAQAALRDAAESFSPRFEDAGGGVVYLDITGVHGLHAPARSTGEPYLDSERSLAHAIAARANYLGLPAQVGIAGSQAAAYLAARDGGGIAVLPAGEEWNFLAPVPVDLLRPSAALAATLRRWGIRTIGDLAGLPANAIGSRLGPEGLTLLERARGEDRLPLSPHTRPALYEESIDIDYGIDSIEPFLFVVRPLLERLTARLAVRGLVCGDLQLGLRLSSRGRDSRTVSVRAPSNDVKVLLTLLRTHLEAHPPGDAIESVQLAAAAETLRPAQLDLFQPSGPAPAKMAATLARLAAICGDERVGVMVLADSHHPEAYGVGAWNFTENTGVRASRPAPVADAPLFSPLVLRAYRPPHEVEVFCQRDRPEFVRGEAVAGRVVRLAGPWRRSGDWWNEHRYSRDYYDVQLSDGGVYRLYREANAKWFVSGSYD